MQGYTGGNVGYTGEGNVGVHRGKCRGTQGEMQGYTGGNVGYTGGNAGVHRGKCRVHRGGNVGVHSRVPLLSHSGSWSRL